MQFNKIACADNPGLPNSIHYKIQKLSRSAITWISHYPTSNEEIIANIGDADCALVSWNTLIDKQVIEACPNLKYIGMCCSLIDENSANVDIKTAKSKDIVVKGVRDYGDEGVIEYIISELVQLLKGMRKHQWQEDQVELGGQKLGIIGMGATGQMLAKAARFFNMDVFYFNRSRKTNMEELGVKYLDLTELLQTVDMVSIHLPKNTNLLHEAHFNALGSGKILINTTLGTSFDNAPFLKWMQNPNNYAIMDKSGVGANEDTFKSLPNMIYSPLTSGFTQEAKDRLAQKVLQNMKEFLDGQSGHHFD